MCVFVNVYVGKLGKGRVGLSLWLFGWFISERQYLSLYQTVSKRETEREKE